MKVKRKIIQIDEEGATAADSTFRLHRGSLELWTTR